MASLARAAEIAAIGLDLPRIVDGGERAPGGCVAAVTLAALNRQH